MYRRQNNARRDDTQTGQYQHQHFSSSGSLSVSLSIFLSICLCLFVSLYSLYYIVISLLFFFYLQVSLSVSLPIFSLCLSVSFTVSFSLQRHNIHPKSSNMYRSNNSYLPMYGAGLRWIYLILDTLQGCPPQQFETLEDGEYKIK